MYSKGHVCRKTNLYVVTVRSSRETGLALHLYIKKKHLPLLIIHICVTQTSARPSQLSISRLDFFSKIFWYTLT